MGPPRESDSAPVIMPLSPPAGLKKLDVGHATRGLQAGIAGSYIASAVDQHRMLALTVSTTPKRTRQAVVGDPLGMFSSMFGKLRAALIAATSVDRSTCPSAKHGRRYFSPESVQAL
jgi:hypothetical protein